MCVVNVNVSDRQCVSECLSWASVCERTSHVSERQCVHIMNERHECERECERHECERHECERNEVHERRASCGLSASYGCRTHAVFLPYSCHYS